MTPLEWLEERLAHAEEFVQAEFDRGGNFCGPMLVSQSGRGDTVIVKMGWSSEEERSAQLATARFALAAMKAEAYFTISEAWFLSAPMIPNRDLEFGEISRRPDRKESVVICGTTIKGENRGKMLVIERDGGGEVTGLVAPDEAPTDFSGALMSLFRPPGSPRTV